MAGRLRPERATRGELPSHRSIALRLIIVGAGAAVAAGGAYVLTVGTRAGQLMSGLILGGRPPGPDEVATAEQVLASFSKASLLLGTTTVVAISLLGGRPRLALAAFVTIVGANVTSQLLKTLLLDRTDLLDGLFYPLPNSFPSGHATAAASIAVALILVLPPLLRGPSLVVSAIVVALVAVSTLVAGWHRMADAIGGVFIATAWGAASAGILAWRRGVAPVGRRVADLGRISAGLSLAVGVALTGLAMVGYVLALADPLDVLDVLAQRGGSPALFTIGVLITVGTTLLGLGSLGLALRDVRLDPILEKGRPPKPANTFAGASAQPPTALGKPRGEPPPDARD